MNKSELVTTVSEHTGLTAVDIARAVDATIEAITSALKDGDTVRLIGFGNFSVTSRAAREGRDPRTGNAISIAANRQPKFTAGKGFKDALNA